MNPDIVSAWVNTIAGVFKHLGELGVAVNLPVMLLVLVAMEAVKAADKAAWKAAKKPPRGARPGDSGYLVAWYPVIAVALGGILGVGWWALVDGGTVGGAVASGCVSGALMAIVFKGYTTWRNFRRLAAKVRSGGP